MKFIGKFVAVLIMAVTLFPGNAIAQSKADSLFSHKGFKLALGTGGTRVPSEARFDNGQTVSLNIGYGFSSKSTLWLSVNGSEMKDKDLNDTLHDFAGFELVYQYKFIAGSKFQPYGKFGFGAYGIQFNDTNVTQAGGGLIGALGFDYFFSRHFGLGLELNFKDIVMTKEIEAVSGKNIERDLEPQLNRDSRSLLVTFTIQ